MIAVVGEAQRSSNTNTGASNVGDEIGAEYGRIGRKKRHSGGAVQKRLGARIFIIFDRMASKSHSIDLILRYSLANFHVFVVRSYRGSAVISARLEAQNMPTCTRSLRSVVLARRERGFQIITTLLFP